MSVERSKSHLGRYEAVIKGLQNLEDIDRPSSQHLSLPYGQESAVIDNQLLLNYYDGLGKFRGRLGLWVTRPMTLPLIPADRRGDVCKPFQDERRRIGLYDKLFMEMSPERPGFFIGEQYEVTLERRERERLSFLIESAGAEI